VPPTISLTFDISTEEEEEEGPKSDRWNKQTKMKEEMNSKV